MCALRRHAAEVVNVRKISQGDTRGLPGSESMETVAAQR
jgi:hypothetical protein